MRKAIPLGILTLLLLLVAILFANRTPEALPLTTLVGSFFDVDYDVSAQFLSFRKESRFIRLDDGTDLAVDIFVPEDAADDIAILTASFPTILEYTPYNRSFAQPGMPWWQRIGLRWRLGLKEAVYDRSLFPSVRTMIGLGYAYVVVDMRGTGASFGSQTPLMPRLGSDGAQIVDWITSQPWSDGSVGMRGDSYMAWSQYATASQAPDGLQCIAPGVIRTDFAKALWEDPDKEKAFSKGAPLRRIGEPDDIAGAVVFLASPAGAYMTGQSMIIDGGTLS